jgi:hypothetical protein
MISKAEEFILDVRRAIRQEQKPTLATDSQLIDPDTTARALQRATVWLTPKVVATYEPTAFTELSGELQEELRKTVEGFRAVATSLPSDRPATLSQFREGLRAFDQLKATIQKVVRVDWETAANDLIKQVEGWAAQWQWVTRRVPKKLSEMLLGEYQLDQLYLHAEGNLYILDPLARFIPGGVGAFVLSIQPSFYVTSIYRQKDATWAVHLDFGNGVHAAKNEPLTKESFHQAVVELRSML